MTDRSASGAADPAAQQEISAEIDHIAARYERSRQPGARRLGDAAALVGERVAERLPLHRVAHGGEHGLGDREVHLRDGQVYDVGVEL